MDMLGTRATWLAIAIFFITVVATKISRWKNNVHPFSTRPLPPAVNILSLLPSLFNKGFRVTVSDLYTSFGSVFTINMLGPKMTLLVGPEVSTHFFQGLDSEISLGNLAEFTVPIFGQEALYGVDTSTHRQQMNFMVDTLKPSNIRSLVDPMFQEVEAYFAKWGEDGIVDLKHELEQVLIFTSSRCLLGYEVRETMLEEVYSLFNELENGFNFFSLLFPYIPTPPNRKRDKAHIRLKQIFSTNIRSRRSSNRVEEDALQRLMNSKYKDGRSTTEAEISGMMIAMIFAAKHTTSSTTVWTGACMLSNTKFLIAAVEEQKHIISKYKNQIGYDALLEMDTLHRCIKEALRMHTAVPMLVRKAHKEFKVRTKEGKEYNIPGGHNIVIPTALNNKLACVYSDPHVYDPDRFALGREEDKVGGKYSFTSFSGGRHACPGMVFAYMQIKVIWSHLLRNFDLKLISPYPQVDWSMIGLLPKGKVMISYKRRQLIL
ncbi:obtusifoliol 14-alpha demethylase-like [Triticum dicoccoides]|uniref:obtusifoliol 14-alpha demethylase-like n=1 Tax=Triticum dicoccoides TaxID=85692 RepID=UPI000E78E326|nr:obtusifoliol 14-alpha demethylase-like [Triticum dicoccoides]XP_037438956.1 obtusifoliol 14-alpha demethylase-like [Triticum dicoccoides]